MADKQQQQPEIEAADSAQQDTARQQQKKSGGFRLWRKKQGAPEQQQQQQQQKKKERPSDAVKLGCGGLFRRKKKPQPAADGEPTEKPRKNKAIKGGTVKIEQGPHTEMWSSIVNKSFIGTGTFKKAAVCSLATGGVLACNPADFTPTVEQVASLRDNFSHRDVFAAAGFGLADTVYQLQEETASEAILCGADGERTQAVLVTRTNTALVAAVCTGQLDRASEMLGELCEHFISQGM